MRRPRALRALSVLGAAAVLVLATPAPAWAHAGGGAEPSNYRLAVTSIGPPAPAGMVRVGVGGQWVRVTGRAGSTVSVPGYDGEPFLRVEAGRAVVNRHSSVLTDNPRLAPVPARPNPEAGPQWVPVDTGGSVAWSDDRLTGGDDGRDGRRGRWTLPLRVDGVATTVTGTWTRVPPPSPWPWVAGLVAVTLAVAGLGWLSRPYRVAVPALVLGGAANAAHLIGGALGPHPGSATAAWGSALGMGALCWPLVVVGVVSAARRGEHAGFAVAIAGAVLAVMTGPGDASVLWHSQLPFPGPPTLERALVVAAFGIGAGLTIAGVRILRAAPSRDPGDDAV